MATSKLLQWQGGSRSAALGSSTKFLIRQSDRPYDTVPKTEWAFIQYLVEKGYGSINANTPDAMAAYARLREQFFGPCAGGDGTLMFGLECVRFDRTIRPGDYKLRPSHGGVKFNGVKSGQLKQINLDVKLDEKIVIDDYYVEDVAHPTSTIQVAPGQYIVGSTRTSRYPGRWTNVIYDEEGNIITGYKVKHPTYEINNGVLTLHFEQKQVGTYTINIEHEFDSWTVTLVPRPTAIDIFDEQEVYRSTIYAFAAKAFYVHQMEVPESAAECIQYAQVWDDSIGGYTTVIKPPGGGWGYDSDGDGRPDGGNDDPCTCWQCGGTGDLPDCIEVNGVDCTCPTCLGTGELIGCHDTDEDEWQQSSNYSAGSDDDDDDTYDPNGSHDIEVKRHKCTGEIEDYSLIPVL